MCINIQQSVHGIKMKFYVYQLRAENEELPFYIGKSFQDSKRYVEHCHAARCPTNSSYNTMKSKKIRKLWKQGFVFAEEILAIVETEELALLLESELIKKYGRRDNHTGILCNHTNGGEGGYGKVISEETKQKMPTAKRGNKINVGRKRLDIRDRCGKPLTMFSEAGKVELTFNSLQECSDYTGIHKATLSDCLNQKYHTATDNKGIKHQFRFGVDSMDISPVNRRTRNKFGTISQYDLNQTHITDYASVIEASNSTGISVFCIRLALRGKTETAGKFIWKKSENQPKEESTC